MEGIGKIYLYDHNSDAPLSTEVQKDIQDGFVEYIPFAGELRFEHCLTDIQKSGRKLVGLQEITGDGATPMDLQIAW
jgi:hypothetical protein